MGWRGRTLATSGGHLQPAEPGEHDVRVCGDQAPSDPLVHRPHGGLHPQLRHGVLPTEHRQHPLGVCHSGDDAEPAGAVGAGCGDGGQARPLQAAGAGQRDVGVCQVLRAQHGHERAGDAAHPDGGPAEPHGGGDAAAVPGAAQPEPVQLNLLVRGAGVPTQGVADGRLSGGGAQEVRHLQDAGGGQLHVGVRAAVVRALGRAAAQRGGVTSGRNKAGGRLERLLVTRGAWKGPRVCEALAARTSTQISASCAALSPRPAPPPALHTLVPRPPPAPLRLIPPLALWQDIANCVWSWATLNHKPGRAVLDKMCAETLNELPMFKGKELVNVFWAMA
eukprot:6616577-Pyramimonas_sp.AAC.1